MKYISLKLVIRSWWRNKTFAIISILSLATGIACTNMLVAYAVYELGIENSNVNRNNIVLVTQDSPMVSGQQITFVVNDIIPRLRDNYPEIKDILGIENLSPSFITVGENRYAPINIASVDSSFTRFFCYEVLCGDLHEALSQPGKIALTEAMAKQFFGNNHPLGQDITLNMSGNNGFTSGDTPPTIILQVVAVVKDHAQSFLRFDALTAKNNSQDNYVTLLLTDSNFDGEQFAQKIKEDKVPTLGMDIGRYYFHNLHDSYFQEITKEEIKCFNHSNHALLMSGLASAFLILLIACFNYINLSFSRVLQQVKMIYTQRLMGASPGDIYGQLFLDTFLTVIAAFLLSLLFTLDLVPYFNRMVSGRLSVAFFFSGQVFPLIVCFILLLSVIPALYLSRKITRLSNADYRASFTGNRRRNIITMLSVAQFAISTGLLFATLTVHRQLELSKSSGECFRNLICIGSLDTKPLLIRQLADELKRYPDIGETALSDTHFFYGFYRQLITKDEQGNELYHSLKQYSGDSSFFSVANIKILQGMNLRQALNLYDRPVYVNKKYVDVLVPKGENPVGKPIRSYNSYFGRPEKEDTEPAIIAGIVSDVNTSGMRQETDPNMFYISRNEQFSYLYLRYGSAGRQETLRRVRQAWDKIAPTAYFTYSDLYDVYLAKNRKIIEFSQLLLMYSLISILLTLSGLFGMAMYITEQRTKEIGIRKINGATTCGIMILLNKRFIVQIMAGSFISIPVTWLLLNDWLSGFIYRVDIFLPDTILATLSVLFITLITVSWHSYHVAITNPVHTLRYE